MLVSLYDFTEFGYVPIKIETAEGRNEYETHQRQLHQSALPLRQNLIDILAQVKMTVASDSSPN